MKKAILSMWLFPMQLIIAFHCHRGIVKAINDSHFFNIPITFL